MNEIFATIQGEATWSGTPSTFVRFQGCDVGCAWCDTKHTWGIDAENVVPVPMVIAKTGDDPTAEFAMMTAAQVVAECVLLDPRHVVLTGGEPCTYDLLPLTRALLRLGYTVQVETSGTYPVRVEADTWVTVSPKINKPGGHVVLPQAFAVASEVKLPVAIMRDVEDYDAYLETIPLSARPHARGIDTWLQPVWQNAEKSSLSLCVRVAMERGWRVSLQSHKYVGLR